MDMFTKEQLLSIIPETQKKGFVPVGKKQEKMIQNALNNYAKDCRREDVVAIYDFTVLGNGKKGYLLATDGMYGYDFYTFKKYTSDVTKIPFEGLKEYYSLKNSPIEAERSIGIGDNLYKFLYEDGTEIVIYQGSVNAEYTIPIIDSVFSLIHAQDEKGSVHSELHSDSVQNEIERKQEELKDQIEVLLRQQEALNRQAEEARLEEERRRAEEARLAEDRRQEEARLAEERRRAEEKRREEEKCREEEERLAEEKRWLEEARIAEEKKNIKESSYNVCFLGDDGVGKRTLIHAIVDFAKQNNETVFLESNELCTFTWKGENITLLPMSSTKLKMCKVDGEPFYLVVDVTEGAPYELQDIIQSRTDISFDGIIYNKCDCAMDEELIDLVEIETMSLFEDNNYEKEIKGYKLAALGEYDYDEVFEEILDDIVGEKWTSSNIGQKLISEADSLYVKSSFVEALQVYEKCALKGDGKAQYMCSQMYRDGLGTKVNWEKAEEYMRQSIASGYANPADMSSIAFAKAQAKTREDKMNRARKAYLDWTAEKIKKGEL